MVSIIVPVYNVELYLDECVESALKLKTDVEVILIDDGSTDHSGMLCNHWAQKEPRVRVIHQENGGLSEARNTGIRNALGEHVLFLDSDDFLDPVETDQMLTHLNSDTDILMGLYNAYYTDDDISEPENSAAFLRLEGKVAAEEIMDAATASMDGCYMTAWRFVCRRDFLLEHDLLFLPGIYHEDEEWNSRLFLTANWVTVTHHYFYQYRQARADSIMAVVKPKHLFDRFNIIERIDGLCAAAVEDKKAYLYGRMGRLYLDNLIHHHALEGADRQRSEVMLKRWKTACAPHMPGRLGRLTAVCLKLFGIGITCWVLAVVRQAKRLGKGV